jgi:hypothetical protein
MSLRHTYKYCDKETCVLSHPLLNRRVSCGTQTHSHSHMNNLVYNDKYFNITFFMIGFTLLFKVLGKIYVIVFGRLENIWMILKGYFIDSKIKECF